MTRFKSDVGGQRCPDSVRNDFSVSVGQTQVQIRNPDTRKPFRLNFQILTDRHRTVNPDRIRTALTSDSETALRRRRRLRQRRRMIQIDSILS